MAESLTTPATLPQTIAENGDANVIPATNDQTEGKASIAYGFPPLTSTPIADGGKMVRRADFNGLFNLLSQYALFAQNGGSFTFDANVSAAIGGYPLGARLVYVDGGGKTNIVISKIPNNTYNFNSDPSYIDGLKWAYDLNLNDYALLNALNTFTKSQYINTGNDSESIIFRDTSLATNNTTPTVTHARYTSMQASNGSVVGHLQFASNTAGTSLVSIMARRTIGGTNVNNYIQVGVRSDGTVYTYAPTPASTSNDTNIATTAFVNNWADGVQQDYDGWVWIGNHTVLQWLHYEVGNTPTTINLMTPLKTPDYQVVCTLDQHTSTSYNPKYYSIVNHTTTSFQAQVSDGISRWTSFLVVGQKDRT